MKIIFIYIWATFKLFVENVLPWIAAICGLFVVPIFSIIGIANDYYRIPCCIALGADLIFFIIGCNAESIQEEAKNIQKNMEEKEKKKIKKIKEKEEEESETRQRLQRVICSEEEPVKKKTILGLFK